MTAAVRDGTAGFGAVTQWPIAFFMLVAGVNFALMFRALRRQGHPERSEEFRLYVAVIVLAVAAIGAKLVVRGIGLGDGGDARERRPGARLPRADGVVRLVQRRVEGDHDSC